MKQSRLDFSATKRKGSTATTGKPPAKSQPSASKESSAHHKSEEKKLNKVVSQRKEEDNSEDIEEFDDSPEEFEDIKPAVTPTTTATGRATRSSARNSIKSAAYKEVEDVVEEEPSNNITSTSVLHPSKVKTGDALKNVKENLQNIEELPHLKVNDPKYRQLYAETREKMGGLPMIHGEKQTKIHEILRVFDNSYEYGPCVGMTRRQRWDRAHAIGLNPPKEIDEILKTQEGSTDPEFVNNIFHGQV